MTAAPRKVVLVTGAGKRIGAEIARSAHARGLDVVIHHRASAREAQDLARELERQRKASTLTLRGDLRDPSSRAQLVTETIARFGRLDFLVNNASSFYPTPFESAEPAQADDLFQSNALAPFFLCQSAAAELRARHGAVVNVLDIYAERPLRGYPLYSMSKAALRMATRALAQQLAPEVRVNAVAPGTVLWSENETKAETVEQVTRGTLLGRVGTPAEVASAVMFLLMDATYSTGSTIHVDGGRMLSC